MNRTDECGQGREFEPGFKNVLGYELEAHMGLIHEKNQGPKILCYCNFKLLFCTYMYIYFPVLYIYFFQENKSL
jgi:hypothetical protein